MTNKTEDWESMFDDEVNRLVAASIAGSTCKPLTELKNFVRIIVEEQREAIVKELDGMKNELEGGLEDWEADVGYNRALSDAIDRINNLDNSKKENQNAV